MALLLSLMLDTNKVTTGRLPEATVRLFNEGPDAELVNSRMLLVPSGAPDRIKEVTFSIKGPSGSINLKRFSVNAGPPDQGNFVRLLSGEYIFMCYKLNKYYSYKIPGTYTIKAVYKNIIDQTIAGLNSWKGTIESNEEQFEMI